MNEDVVVSGASACEAAEELCRSGALSALFERLDAGEVEMTGSQGLLPALLKGSDRLFHPTLGIHRTTASRWLGFDDYQLVCRGMTVRDIRPSPRIHHRRGGQCRNDFRDY